MEPQNIVVLAEVDIRKIHTKRFMGNSGSSDGAGGSDSNVSYVGTVSAGDSYYQEVSYKDGSTCTTVGDSSSIVSVSTCTTVDGSKETSVDVGDIKTCTVVSMTH